MNLIIRQCAHRGCTREAYDNSTYCGRHRFGHQPFSENSARIQANWDREGTDIVKKLCS